jgi:hypothetical protein
LFGRAAAFKPTAARRDTATASSSISNNNDNIIIINNNNNNTTRIKRDATLLIIAWGKGVVREDEDIKHSL